MVILPKKRIVRIGREEKRKGSAGTEEKRQWRRK